MGIELNQDQVFALYKIEDWWSRLPFQVFCLSGAPGTGKSTFLSYFIDRIELDKSEVAFVSFSGKAATRLARLGLPAQTIHSLIYDYMKVLDLDENGKVQLTNRNKPKMKYIFKKKDKLPKNIKLLIIDEASMVNREIGEDLLSYGIPVIAVGDVNQLPPVMGNLFFLQKPHYHLTQIMRQNEDNPIIWISQQVLENKPLKYGVYGSSSILPKKNLNEYALENTDIVLTNTNKLRFQINTVYREKILQLKKLELPNVGEKVICRRNNWHRSIQDSIYLTNGLTGFIDYVDIESFNGKEINIDFRPDFLKKKFKNLTIDYKRLMSNSVDNNTMDKFNMRNIMEFAYAITVFCAQGSEWDNVIYLNERGTWDPKLYKKLVYTAITRASKSIQIYQ